MRQRISSPLTGLFDKAIVQSGSAVTKSALVREPVEIAYMIGRKLGFQCGEPKQLLLFLKSLPAEKLLLASAQVQIDLISVSCYPLLRTLLQIKASEHIQSSYCIIIMFWYRGIQELVLCTSSHHPLNKLTTMQHF